MTPLRPKTFGSLIHCGSRDQVSEVVEAQKQSGTGLESFKKLVYDFVRQSCIHRGLVIRTEFLRTDQEQSYKRNLVLKSLNYDVFNYLMVLFISLDRED